MGNISQSLFSRRTSLIDMSPIHILQPFHVPRVNIPKRIRFSFPLLQRAESTTIVSTCIIERRQYLHCHRESNVGNVEEGVGERGGCELIIFVEGSRIDIETLGAGVGDHNIGDGAAAIVDSEGNWDSLGVEELDIVISSLLSNSRLQ